MHFYSVVLGLDVLGNPAGFIRGLAGGTKGIFYHPLEVGEDVFRTFTILALTGSSTGAWGVS